MKLFERLPFGKPKQPQTPLFTKVKDAMAEAREYAKSHGGDIKLVDVSEDGVVKIKLVGACRGCPMSALTLKFGVEMRLKQLVPEVTRVVQQ